MLLILIYKNLKNGFRLFIKNYLYDFFFFTSMIFYFVEIDLKNMIN